MRQQNAELTSYKQYLDRSAGWNCVAGLDVQRRRQITRYMLCINTNETATERAVILSTQKTRTDWQVAHKGKPIEMIKLFESFDRGNELQ